MSLDQLHVPAARREILATKRRGLAPWERSYIASLVALDAAAAAGAAVAAHTLRFGEVPLLSPAGMATSVVALPVVWVLAMLLCRTYERRFLGVGSEEYRRVLVASVSVVAVVGTASWALELDVARGYVVAALPLATFLTLVQRYARRKLLHARRAQGQFLQRVLLVGHASSVAAMAATLRRASYHGLQVVGACVPGGVARHPELERLGIPVLGSFADGATVAKSVGADVVAVLPSPELDGLALRRLGWDLEDTEADLVIAPAVTELIGPRVTIRPVCGLPLLHVSRPELSGVRRLGKGIVDRSAALFALVLLLPLLLVVAAFIKIDSRGPVLYRQKRVGELGRDFTMLKFRSMVPDAEQRLIDLRERSDGNGVLFKMRSDPRVTRVGRVLRKYSLDELPQLINVLRGDMSLVGPRPPLRAEVDLYGDHVLRRLLVKPGITGLWQVNGRSELDWDESVRLDLRYVENWSFAYDFVILWRTFSAVAKGRGAY